MLYNIYLQLGVLPELDAESLGLFTASERILQDFAETKHVDATFIKDLIQKVLHHPDFDPAEVDHDMHQRLMGAIAEGDLQVIDLHEEGDGNQDVRLFKRPVLMLGCSRDQIGWEPVLYFQGVQGCYWPFSWPRLSWRRDSSYHNREF
jgi:hypothetical protein